MTTMRWTGFLVCAALALASVATAGTPKGEIAAGYAFLNDRDLEASFPVGWVASGAVNVTDKLGVVIDLGGSYKTDGEDKYNVHAGLVGVRLAHRGAGKIVPFGQLLAGAARSHAKVDSFVLTSITFGTSYFGIGGYTTKLETSETKFALQPGAGVDIGLSSKVAARLGADYRLVFADSKVSEIRAYGAIVIGIGSR